MKVLITGASGQLGLSLISALQTMHWVDLLFANKHELNITDSQQVQTYFEKNYPDIVINTAAFTSVDGAEAFAFEANQTNHLGARNLANASAKINAVIIHISTDYVFSGEASSPYVESDLAKAINIYGQTKLAGDNAVAQSNPRHIILRTSWLFSEIGKNFYLTIAHLLSTQNRINVVNDQIGAPTYILDLVNVILKIIGKLREQGSINWGVYHYSGYPFVSWFDFAKQIQGALYHNGSQCEVVGVSTEFYHSVAKRPLYSCLNSAKACDYFDVKASDWLAALHRLAINPKE